MQVVTVQSLRDARMAAGLTCREVAAQAGLSWSSIAHFETGQLQPSPKSLEAWQGAIKTLLAARACSIANQLASI